MTGQLIYLRVKLTLFVQCGQPYERAFTGVWDFPSCVKDTLNLPPADFTHEEIL